MYELDVSEVENLQKAMQEFQGDVEATINDVLHSEAGNLIQTKIYRLMPVSNKKKGVHAKNSKALQNINSNLAVTVTTTSKFHYLYFPDDGTNTRRHVGNQQFFFHGGEVAQNEIIDRCINKLINNFEEGV